MYCMENSAPCVEVILVRLKLTKGFVGARNNLFYHLTWKKN